MVRAKDGEMSIFLGDELQVFMRNMVGFVPTIKNHKVAPKIELSENKIPESRERDMQQSLFRISL